MNKGRSTPQRMCVACREMKDKQSLLRVVKSPTGAIGIDPSGKQPGRGAYLCADAACLQRARKARSLEKALKTVIEETLWQELAARLPAAPAETEQQP